MNNWYYEHKAWKEFEKDRIKYTKERKNKMQEDHYDLRGNSELKEELLEKRKYNSNFDDKIISKPSIEKRLDKMENDINQIFTILNRLENKYN